MSRKATSFPDFGIHQGRLFFYSGTIGFASLENEDHVLYHERGHKKVDTPIFEHEPSLKPYYEKALIPGHDEDKKTFINNLFEVFENKAAKEDRKLLLGLNAALLPLIDSYDAQRLAKLVRLGYETLRSGEEAHWPSTRDFMVRRIS